MGNGHTANQLQRHEKKKKKQETFRNTTLLAVFTAGSEEKQTRSPRPLSTVLSCLLVALASSGAGRSGIESKQRGCGSRELSLLAPR